MIQIIDLTTNNIFKRQITEGDLREYPYVLSLNLLYTLLSTFPKSLVLGHEFRPVDDELKITITYRSIVTISFELMLYKVDNYQCKKI